MAFLPLHSFSPSIPHLLNPFAEGIRTKKHPAFSAGTENKYTGNTPWALAEYKAVIQQRSCSLSENSETVLNTASGTKGEREERREEERERGGILMSLPSFPFVMSPTKMSLNSIASERRNRKGNGLIRILCKGEKNIAR